MKSVQNPQSLIKWMRRFMIFCGQWVYLQDASSLYNINKSWIYLYIAEIHLAYFPTVIMMWQCKSNVNEIISLYFRIVGVLVITIILKHNGMMDMMRKILGYEKNELPYERYEVRSIYEKHSWMMNLVVKVGLIGGIITVANWYILGKIIKVEKSEECPLVQGLLFQLSYPFEVENHMWAARLVDITIVSSAGVFLTYSKLVPVCLLFYVLAHIKMLKEHIRTFDKTVDSIKDSYGLNGNEVRLMALKVIFKKHQELISLLQQVQSISGVVVMIFYFSDPIAMASYLVLFLLVDDWQLKAKVSLPFLLTISLLYVFSRIATEIIEESLSLADEIYNKTDWRNYEMNEQKLLVMMIRRAQQQLSIKAAVIGDTSLETFKKIVKMCYSIQTFIAAVR